MNTNDLTFAGWQIAYNIFDEEEWNPLEWALFCDSITVDDVEYFNEKALEANA